MLNAIIRCVIAMVEDWSFAQLYISLRVMMHATHEKRALRALLQWSLSLNLIAVPTLSVHTPQVIYSLLAQVGVSESFVLRLRCKSIVQVTHRSAYSFGKEDKGLVAFILVDNQS